MGRRTHAEIDAVARAHERVALLAHADRHAARVDAALAAGKIDAETATLTKRHIAAFAEEAATGLHVDGHDSIETRRTVRRMLEAAGRVGRP